MLQKIQCKILFSGSMSEAFEKVSSVSDEYEYSNIRVKLPLNIIRIHIHAISGV